jgi:hypothetical protein
VNPELEAVAQVVQSAPLAEQARHAVTWCLGQLPTLYRQLDESHDTRYRTKILDLQRNVVRLLGKNGGAAQERFDALNVASGVEDERARKRQK